MAEVLFPDPQIVIVEIAVGGSPDTDPDDLTWVDVSDDLKPLDGVRGSNGRADEQTTATPLQWAFTLDDTRGTYTPAHPISPHYPHVRIGTPCRITPRLDDGASGQLPVDAGYIVEWLPRWPAGDLSDPGVNISGLHPETDSSSGGDDPGWARVEVVMAGPLRRLKRGIRPFESPLTAEVSGQQIVATADNTEYSSPNGVGWYWPFEEQTTSDTVDSAIDAGHNGTIDPDVSFGNVNLWAGSKPLPRLPRDSTGWMLPVPDMPVVDEPSWRVDALFMVDRQPTTDTTVIVTDFPGLGNSIGMSIAVSASDEFVFTLLQGNIADDVFTHVFTPADVYGQPMRLTMSADYDDSLDEITFAWSVQQVPPSGDAVLIADDSTTESTTVPRFDRPKTIQAPGIPEDGTPTSIGHVTVSIGANDDPFNIPAVQGYLGERAGRRFIRLCQQEGVGCEILGDPDATIKMGVQPQTSLVDNFRDLEVADGGIIYERRVTPGIGYRTFDDLLNQSPSLQLDASPHGRQSDVRPQYQPQLDDKDARNELQVTRPAGTARTVRNQTDILQRGLYSTSRSYNVVSDELLLERGGHDLLVGTWPGMRVREIQPQINQRYELARPWHEMFQGDLITVDGLPPQHPPGPVNLLLRGRRAIMEPYSWVETGNTTPAGPYLVGQLGGSGDPGDTATRYDSSRSYLRNPVDASATTLRVYIPVQRAMMPNSDFEGDSLGYFNTVDTENNPSGSLERTAAEAFRGVGSMRYTPNGDAAVTSRVRTVTLTAVTASSSNGVVYQFSVWVWSAVGGFDVALEYSAAIIGEITAASTTAFVTVPAGQWMQLFAEETVNTVSGERFDVYMGVVYADAEETEPLLVDDMEVGWRGRPWVNAIDHPGEFPFDVTVGGERMRVTSATAPDSERVQELTVTRGMDGLTVAHDAGEDVRLAAPLRFAADPR